MKEKVVWLRDSREVLYPPGHFEHLRALRAEAAGMGSALGAGWQVHGSVARGDVKKGSDVDIVFPGPGEAPSYMLELKLEKAGLQWTRRTIVMATPNSTPKGHVELGERASITFPLGPFRPQEEQFYRFGGMLPVEGLERAGRIAGVSKKLLLIMPTKGGHVESSMIGREAETARLLGVSSELVRERVRVLTRRDAVGRTGVYLDEEVPEGSSFEEHLKFLCDRDPAVRRSAGARRGRGRPR